MGTLLHDHDHDEIAPATTASFYRLALAKRKESNDSRWTALNTQVITDKEATQSRPQAPLVSIVQAKDKLPQWILGTLRDTAERRRLMHGPQL